MTFGNEGTFIWIVPFQELAILLKLNYSNSFWQRFFFCIKQKTLISCFYFPNQLPKCRVDGYTFVKCLAGSVCRISKEYSSLFCHSD